MKRPLIVLAAVAAAAALLVAGYLGGRRQAAVAPSSTPASTAAAADAGKVLYWYDPMLPEQHFDKPGLSPMGMQMVPRYADGGGADESVVRIDPATVQNLGVRTVPVERRVLSTTLHVPGTVTWNPREAITVSARVDAVVSRLHVRAPYTRVAAGEPLAELLAPQWSSALAEYDALQGAQSAGAKALRRAARERLQVLGLTAADIRAARAAGPITLHAAQAGTVTALEVREGQRVGAGQTLMTLNDLATVWVEASLPQAIAGTVRAGTPVAVTVDAFPGQVFRGSVETLLPEVDSATRTQRARIVLANPDGRLSPGLFATVQLQPAEGGAVPVVPSDALIATGTQTRVIVAEAGGRFRPLAVRTGRSADGYTEILDGLHGGEKVVVSGQFLIDSEASLSGALERLGAEQAVPAAAASAAPPATSHDAHAGHAMPSGGQP
ncbi:efflux RND transporter periplasmic adaptor subunit [Rhodanobacter denitrificans]|uniref:efflux RND transporter periplasmic adaptor subunit n=1 Tax=Rhodanobacter denitrificans TaxID=666685 RepID=UPI000260F33E|nr:efflux RND transporter periplasmic adaptor subunit [Rhodanobacter denitrificans]EIM00248.1 Cobalt/zinc/cadmium efflux RND transporter,membrane fusion protein, CzcB family [Rhodanobacter denitrificans]UJJ52340.1 efflux RND transporter periplasmic adaptor subunit [Rhodanobacter denitrificans]UJM89344.1 efflux RND transporter periplasmic adaptor subunit [Rhodanobacter denitrificans]